MPMLPPTPSVVPLPLPASTASNSQAVSEAERVLFKFLSSIEPPTELIRRDELERSRLESLLRQRGRWRDVRVVLFGSAGSGLRVGHTSDVDLCILLPQHQSELYAARQCLRRAEEQYRRLGSKNSPFTGWLQETAARIMLSRCAAIETSEPEATRAIDTLDAANKSSRITAQELDQQLKKLVRLSQKRETAGDSACAAALPGHPGAREAEHATCEPRASPADAATEAVTEAATEALTEAPMAVAMNPAVERELEPATEEAMKEATEATATPEARIACIPTSIESDATNTVVSNAVASAPSQLDAEIEAATAKVR